MPSLANRVAGSAPDTRAISLVLAGQQGRFRLGVEVENAELGMFRADSRIHRPGAGGAGPGIVVAMTTCYRTTAWAHVQPGVLRRAVRTVMRHRMSSGLAWRTPPRHRSNGHHRDAGLDGSYSARAVTGSRSPPPARCRGTRPAGTRRGHAGRCAWGGSRRRVALLDVLAVVALGVRQAEQALLQDRVPLVPQRKSQAQPLLVVADPGDAILTPPVRARPRLIMTEVRPGVFAVAVVFPDRPPLTLTEIWPPGTPRNTRPGVLQPPLLGRQRGRIGQRGRAPAHQACSMSLRRSLQLLVGSPGPLGRA